MSLSGPIGRLLSRGAQWSNFQDTKGLPRRQRSAEGAND